MIIEQKARAFFEFPDWMWPRFAPESHFGKNEKSKSEQGVYGRRWPHFAVCVDSLYVGSWHD